VASLHRDDGGEATPHPIVATFASPSPIFPMKLTQIAQSKTLVELFVVADRVAAAGGFQTIIADRFGPDTSGTGPAMESGAYDLAVGHPDAMEKMWDGCIVTKLTAELSPRQMDRDVELELAAYSKPWRLRQYSARARADYAQSAGYGGAALWLLDPGRSRKSAQFRAGRTTPTDFRGKG
jgi:hypothetical protein